MNNYYLSVDKLLTDLRLDKYSLTLIDELMACLSEAKTKV